MKVPMREKYVDERVGIWFIFGTNPDTGEADVSDQNKDIFESLPEVVAVRVVEAQEKFREELYSILCNKEK